MNVLRPSTLLLRQIARCVCDSKDPRVRAWAEAIDRKFSAVSIVKTYRGGRLCGYEVWRHLASAADDPFRHKARLWFGVRHWRSELGYEGAAIDMARRAARRLRGMSRRELLTWWKERANKARPAHRLPDDHLLEVRLDYSDMQRMSHVFQSP
jgi:hypothetical protein